MDTQSFKRYSEFVERMVKDKESAIEAVDRLLGMNIDHVRSFTATLLTLNITVIGAVIAAYITNGENIPYSWLVMAGISVLLINTVCVFFYSAVVLIGENKTFTKRRKFLKDSFDTVISLTHKSAEEDKNFEVFDRDIYLPKLKEFAEIETDDVKRIENESWGTDYLYLFCVLFIFGLAPILLGIYPWVAHFQP